jgi:hypothetical protein
LFKSRFAEPHVLPAFKADTILKAWEHLPANCVRPERNRRQHLSAVLSRNEVNRAYAYNRSLFKRVLQGWYQFNPALAVRRRQGANESWVPALQALNLALINEVAMEYQRSNIGKLFALAGETSPPVALAAELCAGGGRNS